MARHLSLLQDVRVASPCPASWDAMDGDDRRRFCHQCSKHVYNFASMREAEIVELLRDEHVCGRLYRRADGTILTADCPTGLRLARERLVRVSVRAAALVLTLFGGALSALANVGPNGGDRFARSPTAQTLQRWIGDLKSPRPAAPPFGLAVAGGIQMGDVAPPPTMGVVAPPPSTRPATQPE